MYDYGRRDRERLLKNQQQEELAENLAGWLLCITIAYLSIHIGVAYFTGKLV
jgi:hypothetical protein